MPEFPETALPNLPTITTHSEESMGSVLRDFNFAAATSGSWPSSNHALFFPWRLESPIIIVKGFTVNGNTATGNIDIGVYDHEFNLLVSDGGSAMSGTATIQEFDITDTDLLPGRYWLAIALSSTGSMIRTSTGADEVALAGAAILGMASAYPLPSTATPSKTSVATPQIPVFGFTTLTTI